MPHASSPPKSTVSTKGQTTIPVGIRRHLKLKPGDRVEYRIEQGGKVVVEAVRRHDIRRLRGFLAPAPRRLTVEQMDQAIRAAAVAEAARR